MVLWNRQGNNEIRADHWEAEGGSVLVAENGYLGKDRSDRQLYALAVHGHNGSGWYPMTGDSRFAKLGIEVQPWVDRPEGYNLICGQRGVGSRTMKSPPNWEGTAARKIAGPNKLRRHPGKDALKAPHIASLESDLAGARRCVIWSSSSGVKALVAGIPVRYDAPHWVCQAAGARLDAAEDCRDDGARMYALHCMAHAQYSIEELESGEPFVAISENIEVATW